MLTKYKPSGLHFAYEICSPGNVLAHIWLLAGPNGPVITRWHLLVLSHQPNAGCVLTPIINAKTAPVFSSRAVPLIYITSLHGSGVL